MQKNKSGYVYILIRADFVQSQKPIYKIGYTTQYPPHKRLWQYPYGSIFLNLLKTSDPINLEKVFKKHLLKSSKLVQCLEIGIEYYQGDLQEIINILIQICPTVTQLQIPTISHYIRQLNRIHYIVGFRESHNFFNQLSTCKFYTNMIFDEVPSNIIYESYKKARTWNETAYPDNYVIRCGNAPGGPQVGVVDSDHVILLDSVDSIENIVSSDSLEVGVDKSIDSLNNSLSLAESCNQHNCIE
jgi:hypothetical protein